jgi:hypothetical protein
VDFDLRQSVRTAEGQQVPGDAFSLRIFKSRNYHVAYVLSAERMLPIPEGDISAADRNGVVLSAAYDPQGYAPALVQLRENVDDTTCAAIRKDVAPRLFSKVGLPKAGIRFARPDDVDCRDP